MIKLKEYANTNNFVNNYIDDKYTRIQKRYVKLSNNEKKKFQKFFPEAFYNCTLLKSFIEDLLCKKIEDLKKTYPSIDLYFCIAFMASVNIKDICTNKNAQEAKRIREMYFKLYEKLLKKDEFEKYIQKYLKVYNKSVKQISIDNLFINENEFIHFQDYLKKNILFGQEVKQKANKKEQRFIEGEYFFLTKIFDYKNMVTPNDKMNVIKDLKMTVCPYCNRSYIANFKDKDQERTSADLDHFYYKKYFVLFALSLYNFVPSCKVCNSLFKVEKNVDILNPYEMGYDELAYFTIFDMDKIVMARDVIGWTTDMKIEVECYSTEYKEEIERELRLFRINEIYQIHSEFAREIVYKHLVLSGTIKDEILDVINKNIPNTNTKALNLDDAQFNKIFYGMDINSSDFDKNNTPLSKLTCDILKEIKLFKS